MSEQSVIVSGQRLARLSPESVTSSHEQPATAADLQRLVGAGASPAAMASPNHQEGAEGELTDFEKASLLMQYNAAVALLREADETPGVFSTTEHPVAAMLQSALAERAEADGKLEAPPTAGREAKFDERDVRWALSLLSWFGKLNPHEWLSPPRQPEQLDQDLKLALVGDWGTGLYGAPECKHAILRQGGFDYVVHLGDIYYSGTPKEVKQNFLTAWPFVPNARSRACNGNHEMYSGGYGYFDSVLPRFGQSSSCFAIQNPDWLLVGLDSAYKDHDLANNQDGWLKSLVDSADGRKLVLFTHHQPFSHFDQGGEKLIHQLLPLLEAGRVFAWYWGHEHRCVVYDRHPKWKFYGRCVGHSGYPYFRKPSLEFRQLADPAPKEDAVWRELPAKSAMDVPRAILLDGPNPYLGDHREKYGPNGYVTLHFQRGELIERYHLPNGTELTSHTLR